MRLYRYKNITICFSIGIAFSMINIIMRWPLLKFTDNYDSEIAIIKSVLYSSCLVDQNQIVDLVLWFLPLYLLLAFFGGSMADDMNRIGIYLFTRQKTRSRWYATQTARLAGNSLLYHIAYILPVLVWILLSDVAVNWIDITKTSLIFILVGILFYSVLLLVTNIVSSLLGSHVGLVCGIVLLIIFIVASTTIDTNNNLGYWLFKLNPLSNAMITWHSPMPPSNRLYNSVTQIANYKISFSVLYFIFLLISTSIVGWIFMRRADICINSKEDE